MGPILSFQWTAGLHGDSDIPLTQVELLRSVCEHQPCAGGALSIAYSWLIIRAVAVYLILALCLFAS